MKDLDLSISEKGKEDLKQSSGKRTSHSFTAGK